MKPLAGSGRGYSAAKAEAICAEIAAGASMNQLNQRRGLPSVTAIYGWLQEHEDFRLMHRAACEVRDDKLADEATAIADDLDGDVQRDRLRIEMRKWRIGVMSGRSRGRRDLQPEPKQMSWEDVLLELD